MINNRLNQLFDQKPTGVLNVYFTAGYPNLTDTANIATQLANAGADIIEIGLPFSDPIADGPTIQQSNQKALENGISLKIIIEQLHNLRQHCQIPVVLMGYINPILQYGIEKFLADCQQLQIDGLIIPDLPLPAYLSEFKTLFEAHNIHFTCLITPQTPDERVVQIAGQTGGFLYMVSAPGVTGARNGISQTQIDYFERIANLNLPIPRLIGFGISDNKSFTQACQHANGAIIGSAFINHLNQQGVSPQSINNFIKKIKNT